MTYNYGLPSGRRIEDFFYTEIQHVKDHVLGIFGLCFPDIHAEEMKTAPDWKKALGTPEAQFTILFESLKLIKPQIGDEMYSRLFDMGREARALLSAGDHKAALSKLMDMDNLGWSKRSQKREPKPGPQGQALG